MSNLTATGDLGQLTIYDYLASARDHDREAQTIKEHFEQFHARNPHIYTLLCQFARKVKGRGIERCGIKFLFERFRWECLIERDEQESFKINNNYAPHYARLIMEQEPDLKEFFETRELRAA